MFLSSNILALGLLLPSQATGGAAAVPVHVEVDDYRCVVEILRRSRELPLSEYGELSRELAGHLPQVLDKVLELNRERRVPELEAGQGKQVLSMPQQDILLDAMALIDPEQVLDARRRFLTLEKSAARCAVGLRVLGRVGGAGDMTLLFSEALWESQDSAPDKILIEGLVEPLIAALADLLGRDRDALAALRDALRTLPDPALEPCIRAVGRSRDGRGQQLILDLIPMHAQHLPLLISQVRVLGPSGDRSLDLSLARYIRPHLHSSDPRLCRAACLALASLREPMVVPELIELLACDNKGVSDTAYAALRELCERGFPARRAIWQAWWEDESEWMVVRGAKCRRDLQSGKPAIIMRGLRDLQEHGLYADHFKAELGKLLTHARLEVRAHACRSVDKLRARTLAPALVPLLQDRSAAVALSAHEALTSLTGLEVAASLEAWRAALFLE